MRLAPVSKSSTPSPPPAGRKMVIMIVGAAQVSVPPPITVTYWLVISAARKVVLNVEEIGERKERPASGEAANGLRPNGGSAPERPSQ